MNFKQIACTCLELITITENKSESHFFHSLANEYIHRAQMTEEWKSRTLFELFDQF